MPPRQPPPSLESVKDWLTLYAYFKVPKHPADNKSRSSSAVNIDHLNVLIPEKPRYAFHDWNKVNRYIHILEQFIQDQPLQVTKEDNDGLTDDQVRYVYKKLFDPLCKMEDGIPKDGWDELTNEVVCNRLTHDAVLFALKSVTFHLTNEHIRTKTEPLQPGAVAGRFDGNRYTLKEKVDFAVVENSSDRPLFLVEGKTPIVLHELTALLDGMTLKMNFSKDTSISRTILNEVIFHMYLWNTDFIVVTSFEAAYIIERHWLKDLRGPKGKPLYVISYSPKIMQDGRSEFFRALLGLTLVQLGHAKFIKYDADEAYRAAITAETPGTDARAPPGGPGGSSGGSSGGSGSGGNLLPFPFLKGKGKGRKGDSDGGISPTSTDERDTKHIREETIGRDEVMSGANGNAFRRITRAMSKSMIKPETPITHRNKSLYVSGPPSIHSQSGLMELECDSAVLFPNLSTSAQVPCLKVLDWYYGGSGIVYEAVLQNPDGSYTADKPDFVIKTIDTSELSYEEYRNSLRELIQEYKAYYLLALAKCARRFDDIIEKFTPTCYGLYQAKDFKGVFALVIDYVGKVDFKDYRMWSDSHKIGVLQSLLALHSLGLYHGDPDQRNIGICRNGKDDTYRFFDYGFSHWHKCPGIADCEELRIKIRLLYDMQEPPWDPMDLQEKTIREYALPFCNLEEVVGRMGSFKYELIILRMTRQANKYDSDFYRST